VCSQDQHHWLLVERRKGAVRRTRYWTGYAWKSNRYLGWRYPSMLVAATAATSILEAGREISIIRKCGAPQEVEP